MSEVHDLSNYHELDNPMNFEAECVNVLQWYDKTDISKVNLPEFHALLESIGRIYTNNYPPSINDLLMKFHLETFSEECEVSEVNGVSAFGINHFIKVGSLITLTFDNTNNDESQQHFRQMNHMLTSYGTVSRIKYCKQHTDNLGYPVDDITSTSIEFQNGIRVSIPLLKVLVFKDIDIQVTGSINTITDAGSISMVTDEMIETALNAYAKIRHPVRWDGEPWGEAGMRNHRLAIKHALESVIKEFNL